MGSNALRMIHGKTKEYSTEGTEKTYKKNTPGVEYLHLLLSPSQILLDALKNIEILFGGMKIHSRTWGSDLAKQ